jgi:hypothetical protein
MVTQVGNWICGISGFKFDADQVGFFTKEKITATERKIGKN